MEMEVRTLWGIGHPARIGRRPRMVSEREGDHWIVKVHLCALVERECVTM